MPRYIVERTFADGLKIPINSEGAKMCLAIALNNEEDRVTWLHSYVSADGTKTYCAYEAPSPEAIRRSARRNNLPIDRITEVRVLDPYYFH
jgi:hypothetical protein